MRTSVAGSKVYAAGTRPQALRNKRDATVEKLLVMGRIVPLVGVGDTHGDSCGVWPGGCSRQ